MRAFTLQIPTLIRFGGGALESLGSDVASLGSRALLVYGGGSIKGNGVYDTVREQLTGAKVTIIEYAGVQPNPLLSHAMEGARLAYKEQVDLVVAVGGGSVIDEAKAIALGAGDLAVHGEESSLWDYYDRSRTIDSEQPVMPVLAVQTLPASSSEVNPVSVLTNDETREKFSIRSPRIAPRVAYLDPETTLSIPLEYTAYACTDILSHVMEGYFTSTDPWAPVHDGMVEGLARGVIDSMNRLMKNPKDLEARSAVMWAGTFAWSGLFNAGVEGATIPNHMLEHPLSAHYGIAHGAGLSICIPGWLKYVKTRIPERIVRFGREVLRIDASAPEPVIDALEEWYRSIGTPTTFAAAGLKSIDLDACVDQALTLGKLWRVSGYSSDDIRAIYRLCEG
ncbi:MAG: iron-containing alcohol dehydrogenase [Alkalispirochaeta sp.]